MTKTLDTYEKALTYIDKSRDKSEYTQFLKKILEYCRENELHEQEAVVLRSLGRTHSIFKNYVKSLRYIQDSLKIQRKFGKKLDIAESLVYLAEELEVSGNYKECINMFTNAAEIYQMLGKRRREKELKKEITRVDDFSKRMVEDEYYLNKFNIDKY